ncbi:PIN domain nuclease [Candidatus Poriferisocius sp.]|uniref:PIN domain nuclease n=1 Tax=Candidatus Poriferisocius sp. TaxID=3101276 RepID=UPI003B0277B8
MVQADYLADTSVFSRLSKPLVGAAVSPLVAAARIALCAPVVFELGFSARNASDHQAIMSRLGAFEEVPVTAADHARAISIQGQLAKRGWHRALSLVDALVAAAAEAHGLVILHYDADFELVAEITGQPHQWVAERGIAD